MQREVLIDRVRAQLQTLCVEIPGRSVGSEGNRSATDFVADQLKRWGFYVECPEFRCMDWRQQGASLRVGNEDFLVQPSPYSQGCRLEAPLAVAATLTELEGCEAKGRILLVRGELAKEQLMPKNFPFFNPDEHKEIIAMLEAGNPGAIVTATGRNPSLAGGLYPFPLIEDGDFDIPSVYMIEEDGARLAVHAGKMATLESKAIRIPATGCNVIGRNGKQEGQRVVVTAHIDAKLGTPGAVDNASGVIVLLLLAELLQDHPEALPIELAVLNGEDYYDASGEKLFVESNAGHFDQIPLGINIDGAGFKRGPSAYSLYECPEEIEAAASEVFAGYPDLVPGEPWYQSDHSIFIQNGVPAMAFTSQAFEEICTHITHTPMDSPEIIEPEKLIDIALALRELLIRLGPYAVDQ